MFTCPKCNGTGYIFIGFSDYMDENNYDECSTCHGEGEIEEEDDE